MYVPILIDGGTCAELIPLAVVDLFPGPVVVEPTSEYPLMTTIPPDAYVVFPGMLDCTESVFANVIAVPVNTGLRTKFQMYTDDESETNVMSPG